MSDQANDLRQRISEGSRPGAMRRAMRPRIIIVAGGKGGVGTTTAAIHLALANAEHKTLLVDADPCGGDVAYRCGVDDRHTLCDLLAGRQCLTDVAKEGPGGIRVVPGSYGWDDFGNGSAVMIERFLEAIADHDVDAETAVIDIGNSPNRTTRRLCQAADMVVVVTNTETAGIVGAYNVIKMLNKNGAATPIFLLVNMAETPELAKSVSRRLAQTGRRFLGICLEDAGHLPVVQWSQSTNISLCEEEKKEKRSLNIQASLADKVRELVVAETVLS